MQPDLLHREPAEGDAPEWKQLPALCDLIVAATDKLDSEVNDALLWFDQGLAVKRVAVDDVLGEITYIRRQLDRIEQRCEKEAILRGWK